MKAAAHSLQSLHRRRFLQLAALTAAAGLAGCSRGIGIPTLRAAPDTLPSLWRRRLPSPWRFDPLGGTEPFKRPWSVSTDLLALTDGWLSKLAPQQLQSISAPALEQRLGPEGQRLLSEMPSPWKGMVLPVGFSPWVMLVRREGGSVPAMTDKGWNALLDPAFEGKLLLPASPRLLISLADHIGDADALSRLRAAALSFDDRFGLNWLLQGDARVAVLPLQRCMSALKRDPRLMAVLPEQGAPLHWTLLVRPADTAEPIPQAWVAEAWTAPLLPRLLAQGWIPPLSRDALEQSLGRVPVRLRPLVLPPQSVWERSWMLLPADAAETQRLQTLWQASAP